MNYKSWVERQKEITKELGQKPTSEMQRRGNISQTMRAKSYIKKKEMAEKLKGRSAKSGDKK